MPGVRKQRTSAGNCVGWYTNMDGKQQWFVGTAKEGETRSMAYRFHDEHKQIRLGYRPRPKKSDQTHEFKVVLAAYFEAGKANGGRNGYPWSRQHAVNITTRLAFWEKELRLSVIHDLIGCLPKVERALRELQSQKFAPKTLNEYIGALRAFCLWCKARDYLAENPLASINRFEKRTINPRRALTPEEVRRLLDGSSAIRRLACEVALCSGFRVNELRELRGKHVTPTGLRYEARWTKNRQDGLQLLPRWLLEKLIATNTDPAAPLLGIGPHPERWLRDELNRAKIFDTPEGAVGFHALRHTYTTLVESTGARDVQRKALSRHSIDGLTDAVYTHLSIPELQTIVEKVGEIVLNGGQKHEQVRNIKAVGGENDITTTDGVISNENATLRRSRVRCPSPAVLGAPIETPETPDSHRPSNTLSIPYPHRNHEASRRENHEHIRNFSGAPCGLSAALDFTLENFACEEEAE